MPQPDSSSETWRRVLVTQNVPCAQIGWHKDKPVFDDVMASSLGPCSFRLRKGLGNGKWQRTSFLLEPRSIRWEWEHKMPPFQQLRYSLRSGIFVRPN